MNLRSDMRQNIQTELDFSSAPVGEAREAGREETESSPVVNEHDKAGQHESADGGSM
jgi:RNA-directed DNA polymerase